MRIGCYRLPPPLSALHMSGVYTGFWPAMVSLLAENLRRFAGGQPLLNLTHRIDGY